MQARFRVDSLTSTPCSSTARRFNTSTPFTPCHELPQIQHPPLTPIAKARAPRKRSFGTANKENPTYGWECDTPSEKKCRLRNSNPKTDDQRWTCVAESLKANGWTLGEFLYFTFRVKDENNKKCSRSHSHASFVRHFLQGSQTYTPAMILAAWYEDPSGRDSVAGDQRNLMFSTSMPYKEIKPVRAALSSFAVQVVCEKLLKEAKAAVKPEGGLHATMKKRGKNKLEWADVGAATVEKVKGLIREHQPLTWYYLTCIASSNGTDVAERKGRPVDLVCTHAISALNFSRNNEARLLPLARSLLYFAYSAPVDLFAYASRIGDMPAYSTAYRALIGLSDFEAQSTLEHGSDPTKFGTLVTDNVQNHLSQTDHRIGRSNVMNVGLAATYLELEDVPESALDLEDKRRRLGENKRAKPTVEQLLSIIDTKHVEVVFVLHWLRILVNYVPQLSKWKEHVSMLFRERAKRLPVTPRATKVHPLATCGKNETISTELKDALVDFLDQIGQTPEKYHKRLVLVGGDGLTYEKMITLKKYLQFHPDPFQSFEILEPVLALWHTEWTDVNRLFEAHWDTHLSVDPSSLGHSAARIGQNAPKNVKKIDYYPGVELMNTVLEARILDCWRISFGCDDLLRYFEQLEITKTLPDIEELECTAKKLHRAYSTTRAHYQALQDTTLSGDSDWSKTVPLGSPWHAPACDSTSISITTSSSTHASQIPAGKTKAPKTPEVPTPGFTGDRVLANSIAFIRDALVSREMAFAVAEGDAGRVYEMMKIMLFTFAGSTHSKYTNYLLETISNLELESSPALRETILKSTLVNLSGRAGHSSGADIIQEYFNRILEAIVERKGAEYGAAFVRKVVSRNLHHFARIKLDLRAGVGLEKRSGRHTAPHLKPEYRKLLLVYSEYELHHRRPGRVAGTGSRDVDDFSRGLQKLRGGKLKRWAFETTHMRGLRYDNGSQSSATAVGKDMVEDVDMEGVPEIERMDEDDGEDGWERPECSTFRLKQVIDGELVFETTDLTADVDEWISLVDSQENYEDSGEGPGTDTSDVELGG